MLESKHNKAIDAFKRNNCNTSKACEAIGISRTTWYEWRNTNLAFAQALEDARESIIDMAEDTLLLLIKSKNVAAVIFFLKCRAKERGYVESPQIIQVQRALGDFKQGVDDPTECISRVLDSANVAN